MSLFLIDNTLVSSMLSIAIAECDDATEGVGVLTV